MSSRTRLTWFLLPVLLTLLRLGAATPPPVWAHEASDIPPDPAVVWGRLDNGFRYALLPNAEPKERVALWLVVRTGSLHEADAQQGLAHFIEHMGFNGTRHFPPGQLVTTLQKLGMEFGADTNASTGFEDTMYKLELPKNDSATLTEGLTVLRDYADGDLFQPAEIDQERGVILAEMRDRDSVEFRSAKDEYAFLLPAALIPRRFAIGQEAVIRTAPRAQFVDYYDTWYRPEKMALVAVGPIETATFAPLVAAAFGDMKDRAPARPAPDAGNVALPAQITARLHQDPELPQTTIEIDTVAPYAYEPDTAANRLKYLPRELAYEMLNRRLTELEKREGAPFTAATASTSEFLDFVRISSIEITAAKPALWREALAVAEQELRRALEHGFQPAELKEVIATYANRLDDDVKQAATRRSPELAAHLADVIAHDNVFEHPTATRALMKPALERVTAADCLNALRAAWSAPGRLIYVAGNLPLAQPEAEILAAYRESHAVAVAAPAAVAAAAWAYGDFGPAGAVAERREVNDLGITQVQFANGVRLNLKKTDFEAAAIHLIARIGGGLLTRPLDKPGLEAFGNAAAGLMGLGRHSVDDLRRILAGRSVGARLAAQNDAFVLEGTTTPPDLALELQLLAAHVADPGFRPEAERLVRRNLAQAYQHLQHTPEGLIPLEIQRFLASGDLRFGLPPQEKLETYTTADLRAWLAPQLATGPIELSVVGDIDIDATIGLVAKTFGALPRRSAKPDYAAERKVLFPAAGSEQDRRVDTKIPRGLIQMYWPTDDARDVHRVRRLNLLAAVFEDRLRIRVREGLGGAYSPFAASAPSDTFTAYGYLFAQINVEPAQAPAIVAAVRDIAAALQKDGVTNEELERAKNPILTSIVDSARTNPYWLNVVLRAAQEYPQRLDWCRTRTSDYTAITRQEVSELAARYLLRPREITYVVLPAARAAEPSSAPPAPPSGPAPATH